MKYRGEIDGLRALAVMPVIVFHADKQLLSGGFIGVDIFFAISGFLIASLIFTEKEQGRFSIGDFYIRRARRILPPLFVVLISTAPLVWLWMMPDHFDTYLKALVSIPIFATNFLFWQESGYFNPFNELNPLLHTWTLAVEEQFYLIFPIATLLLWRFTRTLFVLALTVALLISLALADYASHHHPVAGFYLIATRAWELLAGCVAAAFFYNRQAFANNTVSVIGFCLVVVSFIVFDENTRWPSVYTLIPIGGTLMVICCSGAGTLVHRLLTLAPIILLGQLSYSLYLWHQPLFAFARLKNVAEPSHATYFLLALLALGLAYLTWRLVETPIRRKPYRIFTPRIIVGGATAVSVLVIAVASGAYISGLRPASAILSPPNFDYAILLQSTRPCNVKQAFGGEPSLAGCVFGDPKGDRVVAIYGDSHADDLALYMSQEFRSKGTKGVLLKRPRHCDLIIGTYKGISPKPALCNESAAALRRYLDTSVDTTIVMLRWTFHLYPAPGFIDDLLTENDSGRVEKDTAGYREYYVLSSDGNPDYSGEAKTKVVRAFLDYLTEGVRHQVIVVYPVPETSFEMYKENYLYYADTGRPLEQLSISHQNYLKRNALILDILDGYEGSIDRAKPERVFCSTYIAQRCAAQADSVVFYKDDDHLSPEGARRLFDGQLKALIYSD